MENERMDKETEEQIHDLVVQKAKAKSMEKEGKETSKRVDKELHPLLLACGLEKYAVPNVGTAIAAESTGSSINKHKLKQQLLLLGMDIGRVNRVIKAASTSWATPYIRFTAAKYKGG